jgi:xanthine dehydrogenase YagR molybdenum-binding subunit
MSTVGQSITRADGPIKVTGAARYAGDQNLPGQLHAVFVASTIPAGRITGVDAKTALAMPGVVRVLVATDMPRVHADLDKITVPPLATRFMPMQTDAVMHEGQPVAIVLAESLEAAEAAATTVGVTYRRDAFIVPEKASPQPADPQKGSYSMASALELARAVRPPPSRGRRRRPGRNTHSRRVTPTRWSRPPYSRPGAAIASRSTIRSSTCQRSRAQWPPPSA